MISCCKLSHGAFNNRDAIRKAETFRVRRHAFHMILKAIGFAIETWQCFEKPITQQQAAIGEIEMHLLRGRNFAFMPQHKSVSARQSSRNCR